MRAPSTPLPCHYAQAPGVDAEEARRALQDVYALLLAPGQRAAARQEKPPAGQEKGASRTKLTPVRDVDLHQPDHRLVSCPPSE